MIKKLFSIRANHKGPNLLLSYFNLLPETTKMNNNNSGVVFISVACVAIFVLFIQIVAYAFQLRKFYRKLDEGYYFVEDTLRWNRKKLIAVHPTNIDTTAASARIINPACLSR